MQKCFEFDSGENVHGDFLTLPGVCVCVRDLSVMLFFFLSFTSLLLLLLLFFVLVLSDVVYVETKSAHQYKAI